MRIFELALDEVALISADMRYKLEDGTYTQPTPVLLRLRATNDYMTIDGVCRRRFVPTQKEEFSEIWVRDDDLIGDEPAPYWDGVLREVQVEIEEDKWNMLLTEYTHAKCRPDDCCNDDSIEA